MNDTTTTDTTSESGTTVRRRRPIGAEPQTSGVHFRVWAPARTRMHVVVDAGDGAERDVPMIREESGHWSAMVAEAGPGTRYRYRVDGGEAFPDPTSRWQPEGPHGPSEVVDPTTFAWTDDAWRGVPRERHVLYEMHVGAFTAEGTWRAAARELPALASLGITTIEVMPVADFPGRFGWGYDGVCLFAPTRLYGTPDDFRAFVDRAHGLGLAVILDVVYNHLGPDGNYLRQFAPYFAETQHNDWGEGLDFRVEGVREFYRTNAAYWIDEFHLDGLRLDATQAIVDSSTPHILTEVGAAVRSAGGERETFVVNENEPQRASLVRPVDAPDGCGLDAIWNDDWHHTALVALTGRTEAYYSDYRGTPQEFVSAAKYGFLFQGQTYRWQQQRRGEPTRGLEAWRFVHFLQNHDQIANSGRGDRVHRVSSPGRLRALTALLLLGPQTPMLFMGQEYAAPQPFHFFADHHDELAALVAAGRRTELTQFPSLAQPEMAEQFVDPSQMDTFTRCKLDPADRERGEAWWKLHHDLLALRRTDDVFRSTDVRLDGAVLSESAFVLRYFAADGLDRLLVVNLGRTVNFDPAPEPLLAPPLGTRWRKLWGSEHPKYGGIAAPMPDSPVLPPSPGIDPAVARPRANWLVTGECAIALIPEPHPCTNA